MFDYDLLQLFQLGVRTRTLQGQYPPCTLVSLKVFVHKFLEVNTRPTRLGHYVLINCRIKTYSYTRSPSTARTLLFIKLWSARPSTIRIAQIASKKCTSLIGMVSCTNYTK